MVKEYHVAKNGSDDANGMKEAPFLTINKAAQVAQAGDTVIVHEGVYREYVNPANSGRSHSRRITYTAAKNEKVVIKGSEEIGNWEKVEGTVWKSTVSNTLFGDYNPFKEELFGDWVVYNPNRHLGNVYLNGMSFYEAESYEELFNIEERFEMLDHWTKKMTPIQNTNQTKFVWYAEVDSDTTTIYGNFNEFDPNEELVEINVRQHVFYPENTGRNYITVRGFEMGHAATPWTPPTADQPGLIGTHWSKGWIIEDNEIYESKCSAISIGKEISTGDNHSTRFKDKPGYQYQLETVFLAEKSGWSKENIGSHIIRNNTIHDCGQNGIVGHLGCVFSEIYDNHIYNIGIKREFYGHEIGGIKLHAAIDVQIHDNYIHDCSLGIWLDWQVQGTRVSRNLFNHNNRDLFIEVTSGPHLVDNNILTADYALDNHAQGGAYVNNIIAGEMELRSMLDRPTPYHYPHSTLVAGFAPVYTGDDRFFNNIFIGKEGVEGVGTNHYDGYPGSHEEYVERLNRKEPGDHDKYHATNQPVYINNNAYLGTANAYDGESKHYVAATVAGDFEIIEKDGEVFISVEIPEEVTNLTTDIQSTTTLPHVRLVGASFENPDGSDLIINLDYNNHERVGSTAIGPFSKLVPGKNEIKVWSKK